jgi:hypothetical protein
MRKMGCLFCAVDGESSVEGSAGAWLEYVDDIHAQRKRSAVSALKSVDKKQVAG